MTKEQVMKEQTIIANQTFDEERALYNLQNAVVQNCTFAGPETGNLF